MVRRADRPGSTPGPIRRRARGDDGIATMQFVLITPVLIFLVFLAIQMALWFHAKHVLLAAAQQGTRVAQGADQTPAEGNTADHDAAISYIQAIGPQLVNGATAVVARDAANTTVTVTVSGTAINVVPGLTLHVQESATGPVERYRAPS